MSIVVKTVQSIINYVAEGSNIQQNVQAICEALFGAQSTDGSTATFDGVTKLITVTDSRAKTTSKIQITAIGLPYGIISVKSKANGSFVIASSEVELSTIQVDYIVLN